MVVDAGRCGFHFYTSDGLFVDTVLSTARYNVFHCPSEYFGGGSFVHTASGRLQVLH